MRRASISEQEDGSVAVRVGRHSGNLSCAEQRLAAAMHHQDLADEELRDAVLHARLVHGLTWEQVAEQLGITRQAVQKRYALDEQLAARELAKEERAARAVKKP